MCFCSPVFEVPKSCPIIPSCSVLQTKEIVETDANPSRYVKLIHPQSAKSPTFRFLRPRNNPNQNWPRNKWRALCQAKTFAHEVRITFRICVQGSPKTTFLQGMYFTPNQINRKSSTSKKISKQFLEKIQETSLIHTAVLAKYSILLDFGRGRVLKKSVFPVGGEDILFIGVSWHGNRP